MNNDDATIDNNDQNLSYSVFDDLHYFKKPWRTLKPSCLPLSNVWWVGIHSTLTICLFCTRCLRERQRKVNLSVRISYVLRFSFSLMYSNTQFRAKHSLNLGLRQKITDTVTLNHSKQLMHVKRAYVSFWWQFLTCGITPNSLHAI